MGKIKLDSRLSAVASLVRNNSVVADVGTDHAYLLGWLLENGKIQKGIAADLRKGPLENAEKTLIDCGQLDNVRLVLSDGLDKLKQGDCDEIVIAGMGGILIKEILERTPWIFSENIHIIAQPMTHGEVLREFLLTNGFKILEEKAATDGKRQYCIISAVYNGEKKQMPLWYHYVGELYKNTDNVSKAYIEKVYKSLNKKLTALEKVNAENIDELSNTVAQLKKLVEEEKYG